MTTTPHLKTLTLEHLPPGYEIHVAVYKNVRNAGFLQKQLLDGNEGFEYAFVDAGVVLSTTHLLSAIYRALRDSQSGRMKSRNIHSEVVFSLSSNNNISESFRRFGITPSTTNLIIVKISLPSKEVSGEEVSKHLSEVVEGELVGFSDEVLGGLVDERRVRKVYKLGGVGGGKGGVIQSGGEREREKRELEVLVLGGMALRGFGS
ncbi:hypothetical protein HYFRA_00013081 [Hymenoscyphus fraxineus]|uniref:EKC/KEOPS complex subunit CGI121 n=1 Tax=Hymenoscyphus fraxineus TaxID=746836 RepID=A0A9N9L699_9HELO|nr:hypothetical protein HYFRA_00013081 [Hymenoscyphus fraxineus]